MRFKVGDIVEVATGAGTRLTRGEIGVVVEWGSVPGDKEIIRRIGEIGKDEFVCVEFFDTGHVGYYAAARFDKVKVKVLA